MQYYLKYTSGYHCFISEFTYTDTLPFLDLGDDPSLFTGVDDWYRYITFPSTIYFNNESYNDAYVC